MPCDSGNIYFFFFTQHVIKLKFNLEEYFII